ncbi:flavodoxin [Anaerobacillus alkalidiazotrophicus]|uniref:Flavodoxin n=1 Tax=Anaerobacillus alkalidiazotrophicus TaxID=472963 RepID=A0A1S2M4J2_9BACI|nr:flavodoxin domain-containing protein [Anaerobacillus alkalidiazotrophicus]OIJ19420.1 flavodoxin [Anaerobacillus alkalidiazotrophicus]
MKTAIIYATSRGTTEKAANILMNELHSDVTLINLKKEKSIHLSTYDSVILGSSIHAGMVQGKMKKFININQEELQSKKLGLFICCMYDGEKAKLQFEMAYPEQLRKNAVATGIFGGEFDFAKMNFLEKFIVKVVDQKASNISTLSQQEIKKFANAFNDNLSLV